MRCIFSVSLNESTLHVSPGAPRGAGPDEVRSVISLLQSGISRAGSGLRFVCDDLVTTVFPSDCRICKGPLLRSTLLPICDRCRTSVAPQTLTLCHICGQALDIDMESARFASQFAGLLCDGCRNDPPPFEQAGAYAVYQNELRGMIHLLKYERMRSVARLLGPMLASVILSIENKAARDLVVIPVPLFPGKLRQRGFNQSELLSQSALDQLNRLRPRWRLRLQTQFLQRIRDTGSQFDLSANGRQLNLAGAFAVEPESLRSGCEVLLIDDIFTTGATVRECSRVLRKAGASKVWVATLSRAQKPHIQAPDIAMWDDAQSDSMLGFGIDQLQRAGDFQHSPAS